MIRAADDEAAECGRTGLAFVRVACVRRVHVCTKGQKVAVAHAGGVVVGAAKVRRERRRRRHLFTAEHEMAVVETVLADMQQKRACQKRRRSTGRADDETLADKRSNGHTQR